MRGFAADVTYIVRPGDTLTGIVLSQGLCSNANGWDQCIAVANAIAAANGIDDPNMIQPGQTITLGTAAVTSTQDGAPVVGPVVPATSKRTLLGTAMLGLAAGLGIWVVFGDWRGR